MKSAAGQEMLKMLPAYYDAENVQAVIDVQGKEYDTLKTLLLYVMAQLFIATASGWGLDLWEKELGLPTKPGKPDTERRSNILAKLRGIGTVTEALLKSVAESYTGGVIEIGYGRQMYSFDVYRESVQAPYTIFIKFIDIRGIPPNVDDMKAVFEEIKPAHLAIVYEYLYLTWDELDAQGLTWDQLDVMNLTWDDFEQGKWID